MGSVRHAVLILAPRGDTHAFVVGQRLAQRGIEVRLAQLSDFGERVRATLTPATGEASIGWVVEEPHHHSDIRSVWTRRPGRPHASLDIEDPYARALAEMEWGAVLDSVFSSSSIRSVSSLISQRAATKPRQLAAASEIGISIPATLITNDPAASLAFVEQYERVIHKVMNEPTHRFLETKMWTDDDLARVGDIELAPIVLQELVVAPYEIRVTFVGDRLFAAQVTAPQDSVVDSRLDRSRLFIPHVLPEDVAWDLRSLMAALGLSFGTIDLKLTESGEYVFLEVNPQGQFLYIEIMTGLPISTALADYLVSAVK